MRRNWSVAGLRPIILIRFGRNAQRRHVYFWVAYFSEYVWAACVSTVFSVVIGRRIVETAEFDHAMAAARAFRFLVARGGSCCKSAQASSMSVCRS